MEIKTKYNIGDKVEIEKYFTQMNTCPICEGEKIITIKKQKFFCPKCNGSGLIETKVKKPITIDITDIIVKSHYNQKIEITYISDHSDWGSDNYYSFTEIEN